VRNLAENKTQPDVGLTLDAGEKSKSMLEIRRDSL